MSKLNPSSCLKVKRDTFFIPDENAGVYIRNNVSSFRMEGRTIYQWIEKLLPMFNGEQTLGELTSGLTAPYQSRVYELAETLVSNGFVKDISEEKPHQLNPVVLKQYASQIEFIESFTNSGAFRFQQFRQFKVLAVGYGAMLVSLISSLLEAGLPAFAVLDMNSIPTNWRMVQELEQKAKTIDQDVRIVRLPYQKEDREDSWLKAVQDYDCVLYVSEDGNIEELRELNKFCQRERKSFIPAICLEGIGLTGPFTHPEEDVSFESAWRRLHQAVLQKKNQTQHPSTTAKAILANVAVFELFKRVTEVSAPDQNQIYLLDLATLEGEWLRFLTHPLSEAREVSIGLAENLDELLHQEINQNDPPPNLLDYFSRLTSEEIGIFHTWGEHNLSQLPLAQCYVQAVDPLSSGPAELLPEAICAGFTHQEAKREAGLKGIEMYVSRWMEKSAVIGIENLEGMLGIGAGETVEEAVCRGLEAYLDDELRNRNTEKQSVSYRLKIGRIEDRRSRFYFHALTTLHGVPSIGMEEDLLGFPVIWVRSNGRHYTKTGLNTTMALRSALKHALMDAQIKVIPSERKTAEGTVFLKLNESTLEIPSCEEQTQMELLRSAQQIIKLAKKRLVVYDLAFEPFLKQEMAGIFGVQLRGEEA